VFLGCEGESERGYGILIRQLLNEQRKDIFLDVVLLKPGGSDPLALLERAVAASPRLLHVETTDLGPRH
jgi:hypothetical protein